MDWLRDLFQPSDSPTVAQSLVAMSIAIVLGLILGKASFRKVSIGVAGVMFAGLIVGHLGYGLHKETLFFVRDIGLILFVYAIGTQVGVSFFSSFKQEGLLFNALAVGTVFFTGILTYLIMQVTGTGIDNMVGIMSGSVTNTPGLGAAQAVINDIVKARPELQLNNPANGYAIAYPIGVVGVIFAMLIVKAVFRVDIAASFRSYEAQSVKKNPRPVNIKCRITNEEVYGKTIRQVLKDIGSRDLIISRHKRSGSEEVTFAHAGTVLKDRDVVMLVGMPSEVEKAIQYLGRPSSDMFIMAEKEAVVNTFFVTNKEAVRKSLAQLDLQGRYDVRATRVFRSGLEMIADPNLVLHFGDRVRVVGDPEAMQDVSELLGNSEKQLQEPELLSLFVGIILGLIVGSLPIFIPGLPVPVKLGMAAGPLIVAIVMSRYGGIGRIHSYLNQSAAMFLKDFGICLFFAAVGISAGETFYETFVGNNGWWWIVYALLINLVPVLLLAWIGLRIFRINYLQLIGLMGGSYTSPPSLAFSTSYFATDIPAQAYATVFPLVTLARILVAQLLVLLLAN